MKSEDAARRLIGLLASRGCTISLAESCTGGLISALMTSIPGVSRVFKGAIVAYDDEVKHRMLGVEPGILQGNGSVSEECARAMAIGAAVRFETDFALAITGIAGPEGGSTEKPVGTICFGLASRGTASSVKALFSGNRKEIRDTATLTGLELMASHFMASFELDNPTEGGVTLDQA